MKETEGGGRYRAWCNHLHKHNESGKQQEVNYDIMSCELCKTHTVRTIVHLYVQLLYISDLLPCYEPSRPLRLLGTDVLSVPRDKTKRCKQIF